MLQSKLPDSFFHAIRSVIPDFNGDGNKLLIEYDIDSFDLMTLRAVLEEELKVRYEDSKWVKIKRFSEFLSLADYIPSQNGNAIKASSTKLQRNYKLNMPQLNISGLSEYWYLKEIGDMHWQMLASSLEVSSDQILDHAGNRLYATFVRMKYSSTHSFLDFKENDEIQLSSEISRFGDFFLSENVLESRNKKIKAEMVTSFVARGAGNSELYKSIPLEEPKVSMKTFSQIPKLIEEYQQVRKAEEVISDSLFEDTYQLDPYQDLNGVGLLYFAAYPHIFDICERKYMNSKGQKKDWAFSSASMNRDIYYLGNADPEDEIVYKLKKYNEDNGVCTFVSELYRKSDGKRLSLCICQKGRAT